MEASLIPTDRVLLSDSAALVVANALECRKHNILLRIEKSGKDSGPTFRNGALSLGAVINNL